MPLNGCRILVLDDDMSRHKYFQRALIGNVVSHVNTFDHCVKAMTEGEPFDVFFLDHDLNDHGLLSLGPADSMYGGVREMTGADVARYIAAKLDRTRYPELVVIHSINNSGAANMEAILRPTNIKVQRVPFNTMNDRTFL